MLDSHRKGYACMTKDLTGICISDEKFDTCKRWCHSGDVVAERIPYHYGYSIRITWHKPHKWISFKKWGKNILWIHWTVSKEFTHKTGEIVYRS